MTDQKLKVLWYSDSPQTATGFATVAKNILKRLYATGKYEFTIVGINHGGDPYDTNEFPYAIYPAMANLSTDARYREPYGRQRAIDLYGSGQFDLVFILQDTFIIESFVKPLMEIRTKLPKEKQCPIIFYFPIDGTPKKSWITDVVGQVDFPVTYTEYAKQECLKHLNSLNLPVIYHGVDKSVFFPMPQDEIKAFRDKFFGAHKDKFIVLNVNRNQPRKDLIRTLQAFKIFHEQYPYSFLFLLCQAQDVGGDIIAMGENIGLKWDEDFATPSPGTYGANQGYSIETVNKIYNAADLVVSTTIGEGWGLSSSESMATKTPILFPKNTSLTEIIGENEERGWFCKSGEDENFFACLGPGDNNILRPLANVKDMAEKMAYIYEHPEEAMAKSERAFKEVWTWDDVCKEWLKVFEVAEAYQKILRGGKAPERNELCFCGSEKKFKHCHGR